jgi:hypothetical protein
VRITDFSQNSVVNCNNPASGRRRFRLLFLLPLLLLSVVLCRLRRRRLFRRGAVALHDLVRLGQTEEVVDFILVRWQVDAQSFVGPGSGGRSGTRRRHRVGRVGSVQFHSESWGLNDKAKSKCVFKAATLLQGSQFEVNFSIVYVIRKRKRMSE